MWASWLAGWRVDALRPQSTLIAHLHESQRFNVLDRDNLFETRQEAAETVSAEDQLRELEQQAQKARAASQALPPGLRAHAGLLLLKLGREDEAFERFREEKAVFPESAPYMDFLLRRAAPVSTATAVQ